MNVQNAWGRCLTPHVQIKLFCRLRIKCAFTRYCRRPYTVRLPIRWFLTFGFVNKNHIGDSAKQTESVASGAYIVVGTFRRFGCFIELQYRGEFVYAVTAAESIILWVRSEMCWQYWQYHYWNYYFLAVPKLSVNLTAVKIRTHLQYTVHNLNPDILVQLRIADKLA